MRPPNTTPARSGIGKWMTAGIAAAFALFAGAASAADPYPTRPITIVVPFAPGGPTDLIARVLGESLQKRLGQAIVIDNRPGAAGNTGMGVAARATPDGYTLLLTSTSIAVNAAMFDKLPYDPIKDFIPISELVNSPNVFIVKAESGIKTLPELIAKIKAAPGTFNYSSPGAGTKSHMSGEWLKLLATIDSTHVPYRGAGPATTAVIQGDVQYACVALPPAESLIKSGRLNALAVTGAKRWFSLPDVPTMVELGYKDFVSDTFQALFAPTGTPAEIVARLTKETREVMAEPAVIEQARKLGFEVVNGTPEDLGKRVAAEIPAVKDIVAKAKIRSE
ncbi:Bug family tripartite tricarboxylate transporter substrate binding protein [Aquabacter spiritensis]|uniref:Tripartite-type tricarboxylate transporter receptor subunit TctC n=1 Tax=Aquabacter spiritensis TaxID=933073 RepID=A0A4R3LWN4_9HYPH|nr:tripartite tricarboxylate transporter substrate binding protein [Aquabacter spiritensis]TCT02947.1 tripartite-type tricarboxylate transporter receptor subunit TctC [Aquabacter spiritensis]